MILVADTVLFKGGLSMSNFIVELLHNQMIYIQKKGKTYNIQFELGFWLNEASYRDGVTEPFQQETVYLTMQEAEAQNVFQNSYDLILNRYTNKTIISNDPPADPPVEP